MRAILFDIGNVLLFFDHGVACRRAAELCGRSPEEVKQLVFDSGLEREFDEGRIPTEEFIDRVRGLLSLNASNAAITDIWCRIFWPNVPVVRLVECLAETHRLVLVSNTNEMHMSFLRERFPVLRLFQGAALSYQVGHRKPAKEIYEAAMAQAGLPPQDCTHVDDVAEYCEAARALGMESIHYKPDEDLGAAIASLEARGRSTTPSRRVWQPPETGGSHPRPPHT